MPEFTDASDPLLFVMNACGIGAGLFANAVDSSNPMV